MLRHASLSSALIAGSLFLLACPPDEPPVDGGVGVDAGEDDEEVDAGPGDQGCGDVTAEGLCDGSVVTFCDVTADELITYDCADRATFPEETTQCTDVTDEWGVDCTVAPGGECAFFTDDGDFVWAPPLCRGTEPACLETAEAFECVENAGTCVEADIGTCDGDTLVWSCAASQPFLIDCGSYGGTCSAAEEACVELPAGAICDDALYQCAAGLDCQVGVCVEVGGGDDAGVVDAGGDNDAGTAGSVDAG